jgi:predicted permease
MLQERAFLLLAVFLNSLHQMCVMLVLIGAGYLLGRKGMMNENMVTGIMDILIKLVIPVIIIYSMQTDFSAVLLRQGSLMFFFFFCVLLLGLSIGVLTIKLLRVPQRFQGNWAFVATFSNASFIGLPIVRLLFPDTAASFLCTTIIVASNLAFATISIPLFRHFSGTSPTIKTNLRKIMLSPSVICFVLGLLLYCLQIRLPPLILSPLEMIGQLTVPLCMMSTGALLNKCKLKNIFRGFYTYSLCLIRLIIIPVCIWTLVRNFSGSGAFLIVVTIMAGMPAGGMLPAMSISHGGDSVWATEHFLLSTLLSILTIPLMLVLSSL